MYIMFDGCKCDEVQGKLHYTWIDRSVNLDAQQLIGCMRVASHDNLHPQPCGQN